MSPLQFLAWKRLLASSNPNREAGRDTALSILNIPTQARFRDSDVFGLAVRVVRDRGSVFFVRDCYADTCGTRRRTRDKAETRLTPASHRASCMTLYAGTEEMIKTVGIAPC